LANDDVGKLAGVFNDKADGFLGLFKRSGGLLL
jgi:hypothetical protein